MLLRRRLLPTVARLMGLGVCALALFSAAGCAGGSSNQATSAALVRVTERDFRIVVTPKLVSSSDVRFVITNRGPDTHEVLIARARSARLPLRSDGITADEEGLGNDMVKELDVPPNTVHNLRLHLAPGRYELFCNMFGHYLGGMRAQLVVT
ncbi:MAG TPA: hypothetical protein VE753_09140 [Gaiellaceae bacterium]|jgi:uncharacterized cupredoxin-like copper-binding protein|nr:hypothetical protein [Gaiellaceae bacterium]